MPISKDVALDLKNAALAADEAAAHLRVAGDTTDGVVEMAAADYLEKSNTLQDAKDAALAEYDAETDRVEEDAAPEHAADVAAGPDADASLGDAGSGDGDGDTKSDDPDAADTKDADPVKGRDASKPKK